MLRKILYLYLITFVSKLSVREKQGDKYEGKKRVREDVIKFYKINRSEFNLKRGYKMVVVSS